MFQNQFENLSEVVTYILHLCCMDNPMLPPSLGLYEPGHVVKKCLS